MNCTLCGGIIPGGNDHNETANEIIINGIIYAVDSDFCASIIRKFHVLYGDEFCKALKKET